MKKRSVQYDMLRIIAAFSVVVLHTAAQLWYDRPVTDVEWIIANSYDALVRFGVPVFVMISGALFLDPEKNVTVKKLFLKNIFRMAVIYFVWNTLYGIFDYINWELETFSLSILWLEIKSGRYHLWYLPMLIGLYLLVPILRSWLHNAQKREIEYFLILFLVLQIFRCTSLALWKREILSFIWGIVDVQAVCSYVGYFVLGYYLVHIGIPQNWYKKLYIVAGISCVMNVLLGNLLVIKAGVPTGEIYDSYGVFTFMISVALFTFFTKTYKAEGICKKAETYIGEIAKDTLGVYLIHIGVLEVLLQRGIHGGMIAPVIGIPVLSVVVFIICLLISALVRRIPWIGTYIC